MKNDIFFWTRHGRLGFLSNFYRSAIEVGDKTWPTVEHYFQAMKAYSAEEREMIRALATPMEAKLAGYHVDLRPHWEESKEEIMLVGLRAKFAQRVNLAKKLLATGDAVIHEDSPWDRYWGYVRGKGKDRLGVLLMQVRGELGKESAE